MISVIIMFVTHEGHATIPDHVDGSRNQVEVTIKICVILQNVRDSKLAYR